MTKRIRKGFSMVELLLLLLFVSLITAALTPVVTKKHFKMPRPTNHGAYLCYYRLITDANGKVTGKKLHEARFSGKALTTKVFDRDVDKCTFEPPQQVSYFHISAIGGGGGGGDSGYTGGSYSTMGPFSESLDPFDITDYMVSEAQRDITAGDFVNYGGQLYGFVHGAASGKGGDQLYATRHDSTPCTINHTETHTYTYTHVVTTTTCKEWTEYTVDDSGSGSGGTGSGGTGSGGTGSGSSDPLPESDPSDSSSTGSESLNGTDSDNSGPHDNHSPGSTPNPGNGNKHDKPGVSSGGGGYWGTAHGNGSVTDSGGKKGPGSNGLNGGFGLWVPGKGHHGHDTYNIQDKKLKLNLPQFRFYNPNNEVAMLHSKYAFLFSSRDLLAYTYRKCTGGYDTTETTYTRTSVDVDTICDEHRDYYSFSTATYKGGAGALGATCRSNYFDGGVGLKYKAVDIPAKGKDGDDNYPSYTLTPGYDDPPAASFQCTGKGENGEVIPGTSTIQIGRGNNLETVSAQNATDAGDGATCDANGADASPAVETSCNIAPVTEGCSPDRYGYCLQRWGRSTWEANATYDFVFTYSQNYLQYGLAGEQGQYKTMVIRSFKDKTADITIGLGGAKGTNGGNGSDGQTTTFGDIITAEGGLGGEGGQLTAPEWLTGYRTGAENWPAGVTNAEFVNGKRIVREEGGKEPEKPKPNNLSSNILNFLAPQDNENIADIMEKNKIGYGGKGGGSRHNCWFGEYRKWLDSPLADPTTTPHQTVQKNDYGELEHSYPLPPDACRNNHERIEANDGQAGAVIIRW